MTFLPGIDMPGYYNNA